MGAALIFSIVAELLQPGDSVIIDEEFNREEQKKFKRYFTKLLSEHPTKRTMQPPPIDFRSDRDHYVKTADLKAGRIRDKIWKPKINLSKSHLGKVRTNFQIVSKID